MADRSRGTISEPSPKSPRHSIVDQPATVAACAKDRDQAKGQGAATNQFSDTRAHPADQAATR